MDVEIRPVCETDAAALIALMNPIIETGIYTAMEELLTIDEQRAFIRTLPERGVYLAAVDLETQRIVGTQDVLPMAGDAKTQAGGAGGAAGGAISTFIALDQRGKGIGSALLRQTIAEVRTRGFTTITASVRADNPQAIAFYQKHAFAIIGTAREQASARGFYHDRILLERRASKD